MPLSCLIGHAASFRVKANSQVARAIVLSQAPYHPRTVA